MNGTIDFIKVNDENDRDVIKLNNILSESQLRCVANNATSIAEGGMSYSACFRAIPLSFMITLNGKQA